MVRPELLSELVPPLAARLPLAVKSPASWRMPVVGSAISWPRVRVLPLAITVSRLMVSLVSVVDRKVLLLVWELRLVLLALGWLPRNRPDRAKAPETRITRVVKPKPSRMGRREKKLRRFGRVGLVQRWSWRLVRCS
jgi:hypothetical protein